MRARVKRAPKPKGQRLQQFCFSKRANGNMLVLLPIITVSELNSREHRMVASARHKQQKQLTRAFMREALGSGGVVFAHVGLTRLGPGTLDTDNLAGSMKYVRDEVARWMCVDDAPGSGVEWSYEQHKSDAYGVYVELRR